MTKTITGIVLARLVLEDILSFADPVGTWLDAGPNGGLTLEQLATHTSGLPRIAPNAATDASFDRNDPYAHYDADKAEAGLRAANVGSLDSYSYSNFGYQLLGICLERAAGRLLPTLFKELVFDPLAMHHATTDLTQPVLQGEADGVPIPNWTMRLHGLGGVNATIGDLVAYLAGIINPPKGDVGAAIRLSLESRAPAMPGVSVALGWLVLPAGIACHGGGTAGFSTYVACNLPHRRGAVVALNRLRPDLAERATLAAVTGGTSSR